MENSYDTNEIDYKDINRKNLYWAAIPFSEARPLKLFEKIDNAIYLGKKLDENSDTFDGFIDEQGKKHSDVVDVVVRHKRRLVIVIQGDDFNHDEKYNYIYVVPLTTFDKNKEKIKFYKNNKDLPNYHYVGYVGNQESVANISDVKRIHKSLLLETTQFKAIEDDVMEEICKKVATFLKIEKLEKCDKCIYNYNNYIQSLDSAVGNEND